MKKLLLSLFALGTVTSGIAQHSERCATSYKTEELFKFHPEYKAAHDKVELQISKIIQKNYTKKSTGDVYEVPVVIHVMHLGEAEGVGNNISDAQIMSGLQQLNDAFRNKGGQGVDAKIEFVLAKQDPNCATTTGIVRYDASGITDYATDGVAISSVGADEVTLKAASKWPKDDYYNIWLVSEIEGNDGSFGTQGFAYYPGASSARDGALILNTAWGNTGTVNSWNNQGKTGIHELGHGLDLYHTFAGDTLNGGCPIDADCSNDGDKCCDTDPHKVSASFTCTDMQTNECTGNLFGDVVHNYMDYSDQDCQDMFTQDQVDRMRAALEGPRASLLVSKGLQAPITSFAEATSPSCEPTTQPIGLTAGYAGIMEVSFAGMTNTSSYSQNDGGYVNFADECLKVAYVHPDSSYTLSLTPWINTNYAKAWIDYNNDGSFDDGTEMVYDQTLASQTKTSQSVTIPNTATQDQFLRMRVLLDLNSVTGACMDPEYGQAEDYSVYIHKVYSVSGRVFEAVPNAKASTCGVSGTANLALSLMKNGVEHYSTVTNGTGYYTFTGVVPGTYDLHVDSSSYDNITAPEITVVSEDVVDQEHMHESTSLNACDPTSTAVIENVHNILLAPNPATNILTLQYSADEMVELRYQITDVQGRLVDQGFIRGANNVTQSFDVSLFHKGIYNMTIMNETGQSTLQFIKK